MDRGIRGFIKHFNTSKNTYGYILFYYGKIVNYTIELVNASLFNALHFLLLSDHRPLLFFVVLFRTVDGSHCLLSHEQ